MSRVRWRSFAIIGSMRDPPLAAKVLLVDDDIELLEMLKDYLQREGFLLETVNEGAAATSEAVSGDFGVVVLDVMMPRVNGLTRTAAAKPAVGSAAGTPSNARKCVRVLWSRARRRRR
jgi:CheY-like chemotaxis protein